MKVSIKYENEDFEKHKNFVEKFITLLQEEFPLKNIVKIHFMDDREGSMSTGSRRGDNLIKVLSKGRLNRDIMRTLAHEWVHEYQMTILNRERGPDIGGQNEDEANAFAGQIIKKFEKKYPNLEKIMYEQKGILKKVDLLSEQIVLLEKENTKKSLITEMKSIGIEELPYSYSSLSRFIDSKTMNVHYQKHYKGYVEKLNKAIKKLDGDADLEEIVKTISKYDNTVRNNAGGAFNHALFWKMLSPKKQLPSGEILKKIKKDFGNIKKMKDEFNQAAKDRFGSGWAWLYLNSDGNLKIMSTPNQDNPLMNVVKKGGFPLLGLDVWEHAYYLKYQNKRDEYINNFWDVVNWEFVNDLYLTKTKKKTIKENLRSKELLKEYSYATSLGIKSNELLKVIFSVYSMCTGRKNPNGCIGKIQEEDCTTSEGIIGGQFTEGNFGGIGNWSIINRFDTNSSVHREIQKIYEETGSNLSIDKWVKKNKKLLFSNNGTWTPRLVEKNVDTIQKGRKNENYAKEKIKDAFNLQSDDEGITWNIFDRCAGDIRDRKDGQDLDVVINTISYHFQIKPVENFNDIKKNTDERGDFYKVPSYHSQNKYKEEKVDVIMYVNEASDKYIMFRNDYSKIQTISNPKGSFNRALPKYFLYYYENPIKTNAEFESEESSKSPNLKPELERNREELIQFYTNRIKYFEEKLKELNNSNEIKEMLNYYKNEFFTII